VCTWVVFLLMTKRVRPHVSVTQFMATMSVFAALALLPLSIATGGMFALTGRAWAVAVTIAVVNGVLAHGLIVWAQRYVEVSTISMLQVTQPALAAMWAFLLLDESVAPWQFVGMAIVLAAIGAFSAASSRPA
jgi:drug/metabolite transporter (DMT)-like permease